MLKKDGLLDEGDYSNDYDSGELTEVLLNLADIALTLADKGGAASEISRNLYVSAGKKVSEETKKEVVKKAVSEVGEKALKKETGEAFENASKNILGEKNTKSVSDILKGLQDITENKRKSPRNFKSLGGYEQTLKDFKSLDPITTKDIQTDYGPGKLGILKDGTKIVARSGSKSDGGATLEIINSKGKTYKIRY